MQDKPTQGAAKKTKTDIDNNFVPQLNTMPFNSAGAPNVTENHNGYFLRINQNNSSMQMFTDGVSDVAGTPRKDA